MQICRYKLENNTLNSVLDCDSNKTITKKICWKGPNLYSAKGMLWQYIVYVVRENCVKYGIAWSLKIVNRYNVHVDILLKPSIGIVLLNRRFERCYFHPHSTYWTKDMNLQSKSTISIWFNYAQTKEYAFNYKIS